MKRLPIVSVSFLLLCSVYVQAQMTIGHYNVHDLGTFGGTRSSAYGINDNRQIVGYATLPSGVEHSFLYSNDTFRDLGVFGSASARLFSAAYAINQIGQVAGYAQSSGGQGGNYAFIYQNGSMTDLTSRHSGAWGINSSGDITGYYVSSASSFLWSNGNQINLGTGGTGLGINDSRQVVGFDRNERAFLYSAGNISYLGTISGGKSYAFGINNTGQIVGWSDGYAFLYQNNSMIDLGLGSARAINTYGQIVGFNGDHKAMIYQDGSMLDLNTLIDSDSGWILREANAINNNGEIVGWGNNPAGEEHAFLLTTGSINPFTIIMASDNSPVGGVPEPSVLISSLVYVLFGGFLIKLHRR